MTVAARTFPGYNFTGGIAKISKINDERLGGPAMTDGSEQRTTGYTYSVKYVMGGSEKRVDARWISAKEAEPEREAADAAEPRAFDVGDAVEARFKGGTRWYPAKVTKVRAPKTRGRDFTFDLLYDDGSLPRA